MKKTLLITAIFVPAFAFAQTTGTTTATTTPVVVATSTQVTCMQTALEKRENALISGHDAYNTSVKTALTNRLTALKASWASTDRKGRVEKRTAAYKAFRNEMQTAHVNMRNAKSVAWKNFETDARACGVRGSGETPASFSTPNTSL